MADPLQSTLNAPSYFTSAGGNLLGNGNSNTTAAANNVWAGGQFQPYSVNSPLGQTSFSNGAASTTQSPLQSSLSSLFGNQITNNLSGSSASYDPNTSFLPSQYQSIFGNMQSNANSMFNSLQQAQQPFVSQYLQSGQDNEFSKGTLASTAGAYQTAGAQTAANSQMNQNQATAQQYALQNAQAQFGAASTTAQQGEQQAEFSPQFSQSQTQGLYSNLLNSSSLLNQQTSLGGSLGALQSNANTNALLPQFTAAQQQDQAQSGLLNGLLTGNGTGGLLGSLFGTSANGTSTGGGLLGGAGSTLGNFLKSLTGGGTTGGTFSGQNLTDLQNSYLNQGNSAGGSTGGSTQQPYDNTTETDLIGGSSSPDYGGYNLSDSDLDYLFGGGFNSAGGQAATSGTSVSSGGFSAGQAANIGLSGYSLSNALGAGSGLGAAGAATGLAGALGAPSSITGPVSAAVQAAGFGANLLSGNYAGAFGAALGLGGKAGLPTSISQPASLIMSILSGNPLGIALNAVKVGSGLYNMLVDNTNYDGSWAGSSASGVLNSDADKANSTVDQLGAQLSQQMSNIIAPGSGDAAAKQQAPTYTPQQLASLGQSIAQSENTNLSLAGPNVYAGQTLNMMNQGEASIPTAPYTQDAADQAARYDTTNPYADLS